MTSKGKTVLHLPVFDSLSPLRVTIQEPSQKSIAACISNRVKVWQLGHSPGCCCQTIKHHGIKKHQKNEAQCSNRVSVEQRSFIVVEGLPRYLSMICQINVNPCFVINLPFPKHLHFLSHATFPPYRPSCPLKKGTPFFSVVIFFSSWLQFQTH